MPDCARTTSQSALEQRFEREEIRVLVVDDENGRSSHGRLRASR
jgi:hypothetical protein